MEALDAARQGNIFDKPARLENNSEVKASVGPRRFETDHMVASIIDSVRHLEIDEEAFSPVVSDLWKQILLVFKEAGELSLYIEIGCSDGLMHHHVVN
jgi:hypothetical protein